MPFNDTTDWDRIVESIATGGVWGQGLSVTTPSREILVSYLLSKLVGRGIHFDFMKAKDENLWIVEFVDTRAFKEIKTWVAFTPVLPNNRLVVSFHREVDIAEMTKRPIGVACGACSRSIMM
jgi:hypothetical protein